MKPVQEPLFEGRNILNIGCGQFDPVPGRCINIDVRKTEIVHIVYDLELLPYPIPSESMQEVYAIDILEHLRNWFGVLEEIHRVLVPNGILRVRTNNYKYVNSYTDPTHVRHCSIHTFDFNDPGTAHGQKYNYYTSAKFKILEAQEDGMELVFTLKKIPSVDLCRGQHELSRYADFVKTENE